MYESDAVDGIVALIVSKLKTLKVWDILKSVTCQTTPEWLGCSMLMDFV